ncbi:uncharacterized protein LOC125834277 [Solanum verrucosum]|uniref:uncharacterized protein LOC125834277 n=1 Tax=Solanum verrucosum TaxID=315347 RepID=UPI0020D02D86|nr:uncharacterized protein LOC125834277 [Solanum verrucosum]
MTSDEKLFKELDISIKSRVRIGNGEYLPAKGKGTVAIESYKGKKLLLESIEQGTHSFSKPAHCSGNVAQKVGSLSSQSFIVYAKEQNEAGIEHQLTVPYSLQQNGVSERKNRTIMEMSRYLLHEKNLPKKFWAEAANTVVFLLNRLPTRAVEGKTPFKAWLRETKKADLGIFIGYSLFSKAYRIFQPQTNKIMVSRDVQFLEDEQWEWNEESRVKNHNSQLDYDDLVDDQPIRGTRSLSDIYERCNVAVFEPAGYEEAKMDQNWTNAMKEALTMIEKNHTWKLVERAQDRKEEIYVEQPEGFSVPGHEDMVYLLKKALYRLKQAPRSWYSRIDNHLLGLGFEKSLSESTLYVKKKNNTGLIEEFKEEMMKVFEMTDLGEMTYFQGMEIKQTQNEVFVCHKKYMKEILKRFRMEECKSVGCFSWCSKKQEIVAQSTVEAEFIAAAATVNQALWLRKILIDLQLEQVESTEILVDNQAAIAISKDPVFYGRTKHFNIKFYFLREVQKNGEVVLFYCKAENQVADIFTKSFHVSRFEFLREKLGVCSS